MVKEQKKKIMIVDDEKAVCSMLMKFFAKKGYDATCILSGEEAIEKVKIEKPNAVLLDIKMPGMDGIEVLKKMREFYKDIIIVMITAVKDEVVAKRCIELGADDYVVKPLGLDYLETTLLVKMFKLEGQKQNG